MHFPLVLLTIAVSLLTLCYASAPVYQLSQEWHLWKAKHRRTYTTSTEELERHLIWVANKKYIDGHNANKDVFGYSLSMNQFGDMVSCYLKYIVLPGWSC